MNVSAKTEYACLAVLELAARHGDAEPVRIREISERHGIPNRFLVQILLQLKGAGVVVSTRGAAGGYQLARRPDEISLGEVMAVIDGPPTAPQLSSSGDTPLARALAAAWQQVALVERDMLFATTLAELVEQAQVEPQAMYYI